MKHLTLPSGLKIVVGCKDDVAILIIGEKEYFAEHLLGTPWSNNQGGFPYFCSQLECVGSAFRVHNVRSLIPQSDWNAFSPEWEWLKGEQLVRRRVSIGKAMSRNKEAAERGEPSPWIPFAEKLKDLGREKKKGQ